MLFVGSCMQIVYVHVQLALSRSPLLGVCHVRQQTKGQHKIWGQLTNVVTAHDDLS